MGINLGCINEVDPFSFEAVRADGKKLSDVK
jgi:hypothetical protein